MGEGFLVVFANSGTDSYGCRFCNCARGRFRLRADTTQLCTVVGLSLVIGSVSMRMVNYVVESRMYVLVLPIVGSVVCVSALLPETSRRWSGSRPVGARLGKVSVLALVAAAVLCGLGNSVALAASGSTIETQPCWHCCGTLLC